MDDLNAIMRDIGSSRAALFGFSESSAMSALFAATYPERVSHLLLYGGFVRRTLSTTFVENRVRNWGNGDMSHILISQVLAASGSGDGLARRERLADSDRVGKLTYGKVVTLEHVSPELETAVDNQHRVVAEVAVAHHAVDRIELYVVHQVEDSFRPLVEIILRVVAARVGGFVVRDFEVQFLCGQLAANCVLVRTVDCVRKHENVFVPNIVAHWGDGAVVGSH